MGRKKDKKKDRRLKRMMGRKEVDKILTSTPSTSSNESTSVSAENESSSSSSSCSVSPFQDQNASTHENFTLIEDPEMKMLRQLAATEGDRQLNSTVNVSCTINEEPGIWKYYRRLRMEVYKFHGQVGAYICLYNEDFNYVVLDDTEIPFDVTISKFDEVAKIHIDKLSKYMNIANMQNEYDHFIKYVRKLFMMFDDKDAESDNVVAIIEKTEVVGLRFIEQLKSKFLCDGICCPLVPTWFPSAFRKLKHREAYAEQRKKEEVNKKKVLKK